VSVSRLGFYKTQQDVSVDVFVPNNLANIRDKNNSAIVYVGSSMMVHMQFFVFCSQM